MAAYIVGDALVVVERLQRVPFDTVGGKHVEVGGTFEVGSLELVIQAVNHLVGIAEGLGAVRMGSAIWSCSDI